MLLNQQHNTGNNYDDQLQMKIKVDDQLQMQFTTNSELMHRVRCKKEEANTKNAYLDLDLCRAMNGPQVLDKVITKLLM
jgi:hypothetical protein